MLYIYHKGANEDISIPMERTEDESSTGSEEIDPRFAMSVRISSNHIMTTITIVNSII